MAAEKEVRDQQAYCSENLDITSTNLTDLSISSISSLLGRWMAAACQGQRLREVVAGSHRLFLNGFCTPAVACWDVAGRGRSERWPAAAAQRSETSTPAVSRGGGRGSRWEELAMVAGSFF